MRLSTILALGVSSTSIVFGQTTTVPVPWLITGLSISNTRHGTGGTWSFNISDTPTLAPQGFNTTCSYFNPTTYNFAVDGYPVNAPCANPNVTFGLYPSTCGFTLNITHLYGNSGRYIESLGQPASSNADSGVSSAGGNTNVPFNDNGTWTFSRDDVRGQEFDARNNFGQSGYFAPEPFQIYPLRAIASSKCEFC